MRMVSYFAVAVALFLPALLYTAWTGMFGKPSHLSWGLVAACLGAGTHTLLILFMIVTGRVLREATRVRQLPPAFLVQLNDFFAKKRAYPFAIFAVLALTVAAVLGYAQRGFGISPVLHMLAGIVALTFNLFAINVELRALFDNQRLLDAAAAELDRIDREQSPDGVPPAPPFSLNARRLGFTLALGAWLPYLYRGLVVWRGDFERVSWLPFAAVSAVGVVILVCAGFPRWSDLSYPDPENSDS